MKTKDFLGREWDIACMGCAVADGSMAVPGDFIAKTQYFCVHQDPLIPLPGFLVIASIRHIHSLAEMQNTEFREFADLLRMAQSVIKKATGIEYLTLVQEESSIHFHLWFFPWTSGIVEVYGKPSLSLIREIMSDLRKQPVDEQQWQELKEAIERLKYYWRNSSK